MNDTNKILAALKELLNACTRYDEEPSTLNSALYQSAKEKAEKIVKAKVSE